MRKDSKYNGSGYPEKKNYTDLPNNIKLDKKRCSKCKEIFSLTSDFWGTDKGMESGFCSICKNCNRQRFQKNYTKHKIEISHRHKYNPSYIFRHIINGAKQRQVNFNLDYEFYLNNLFKKKCYYCGSDMQDI